MLFSKAPNRLSSTSSPSRTLRGRKILPSIFAAPFPHGPEREYAGIPPRNHVPEPTEFRRPPSLPVISCPAEPKPARPLRRPAWASPERKALPLISADGKADAISHRVETIGRKAAILRYHSPPYVAQPRMFGVAD